MSRRAPPPGPNDERDQLRVYFVLAFAISWGGILAVASRTGLPATAPGSEQKFLLVFLAMLAGPSLACLGLTAALEGTRGLRALWRRLARWRIRTVWYPTLLVAPGLLLLILAALSLVSPAFMPGPANGAWRFEYALIGGFLAGSCEELGWTGFATPRLLRRHGWFSAGVRLGPLWAAWHVLGDYWGGAHYGGMWLAHMLEWFVALTAFRVLMTWAYDRTGSLLLGVLLHASFTGAQALLWPARASVTQELVWYGLFAAALWVVVAAVGLEARRAGGAFGRPAASH